MTITAIKERHVAASHLERVDEHRDLTGAALEGQDLRAAAAHLDSVVHHARACAKALRALHASEAAQ